MAFIPIPADNLPAMVGKPIHFSWAKNGCVWILRRIEGDKLHCYTPKSLKPFVGNAADACYTRRHEPAS